jgi:hypothetical protein
MAAPNNNKAKCIPGGTLRVLAGKNDILSGSFLEQQWLTIFFSCSNHYGRQHEEKLNHRPAQ